MSTKKRPDPKRQAQNRRNAPPRRRPNNYQPRSGRYYSHDSSARQVAQEEQFQPEQRPQASPIMRRRTVRTRRKAEIVYDKQANFRKHFMTHVLISAFFIAVLGFFVLQLNLQYTHNRLGSAQEQLASLQEVNRLRTQEMYAALNLDLIREIAVNELGMIEPNSFQIQHLHAPRADFVLNFDEPTVTHSNFSIAGIRSFFTRNND